MPLERGLCDLKIFKDACNSFVQKSLKFCFLFFFENIIGPCHCFTTLPLKFMKMQIASAKCDPHFS